MKVWVNLWRYPRSSPPFEATVHASAQGALEAVADDAGAYAGTVLIDPSSLEPAQRLDPSDAAHELMEDRRIEREEAEIEARMLRWRQAGL